ncbi:MAG: hypothetical protein IPP63_19330 [Chloracidobacterium sp.]|nr:hypothetical protein [Chloracidobacterium sp.]
MKAVIPLRDIDNSRIPATFAHAYQACADRFRFEPIANKYSEESRYNHATGSLSTPTPAANREKANRDRRSASIENPHGHRSCPQEQRSLSSAKHLRAVRTPPSKSAVSIDETSVRQRRSPVFLIDKMIEPAVLFSCLLAKNQAYSACVP